MDFIKAVKEKTGENKIVLGRYELVICVDETVRVSDMNSDDKPHAVPKGFIKSENWEIYKEKDKYNFIDELGEAYGNRCFGDILDVIRERDRKINEEINETAELMAWKLSCLIRKALFLRRELGKLLMFIEK